MKKSKFVFVCMLFCGLMVALPSDSMAKKKKKKGEVEQKEPEKKPTPYEKLFKDKKCTTVRSNFVTVHKIEKDIYLEFPLRYMGREMLFASTPTRTGNPSVVNVGYKAKDPLHVKFQMGDSAIFLLDCATYTTLEPGMERLAEKHYIDSRIEQFPLAAYSPDSTAVVFNATDLFNDESPLGSPIAGSIGGLRLTGSLVEGLSSWGRIKAFDDNFSVETAEVYSCSASYLVFKYLFGNVTIYSNKSFLLLPEKKMKPRLSDPRVGIFLTGKEVISSKKGSDYYSYANRWRLEPKDMQAWERGELVEPVKPIVFYVDNEFPEAWKAPIKEAVVLWNKAFEKIGFKNAIQAVDFPENDPEFDPDNLKYSCIRYCPVGIANAMGPSWVDPTTGEIINASVIVYNDIVKLINNWRFVQTAQLDEAARSANLSQEEFNKSLIYVIAHEVGHTLGFMHNMAASNAFPVDSLRSVTFTQKYGTTPSIMDYARFNYVAQPEDKGVKLSPPDLGVYDYYTVKWNYSPIAGNKSVEEEARIVRAWVDEKAGDPIYRYGQQQLYENYDPTALMEDLGDDPIKAGEYGIKNLKYILSHLDQWITNDDYAEKKQALYSSIYGQYYRYLSNVVYQIGGTKLTEVREGTPGERCVPLSRELQKQSLDWVLDNLSDTEWLDEVSVAKDMFATKYSTFMQASIASLLMAKIPDHVTICSHISDDPFTLKDYYNALFDAIWASKMSRKKLTDGEKMLQRYTTQYAFHVVRAQIARNSGLTSASIPPMFDAANLSVDEIIRYGLDPTGFVKANEEGLKQFERENGVGIIAEALLNPVVAGSSDPYGWQRKVDLKALDEKYIFFSMYLDKVEKLLKARIASVHPDDRPHYDAMLKQVLRMNY